MDFMPIFTRLAGRAVLVVGGGTVAQRKVKLLCDAGARVTVVAPRLCRDLEALARAGVLRVEPGPFRPEMLEGMLLTYAATDDPAVNAAVFAAGERAGRLVNAVDDPEHCSFITPAIVDRSPLVAAISSGGAAPVLARHLRMALETRWPETLGSLARLIRKHRGAVAARWPDVIRRRRFYESLLDHAGLDVLLRAGRLEEAEAEFLRALDRAGDGAFREGRVVLVGAGPGDPGLLTLHAVRHLERADVILHDRLVPPEVLAKARRDAKLLSVEKMPRGGGWTQESILEELYAHARAGLYVVRLKGGDPFIFGRGGEEAEYLRARGVAVEVVPGITAALGCAAAAGIPLTHREDGHGVRLVTAVGRDGADDPMDDPGLAAPNQTLAVYMGVRAAPRIQSALLAHGRDPNTPAAIIEHGTTPRQRTLFCVLGGLAATLRAEAVAAPALVFIGETVARAPGFPTLAPAYREQGWREPVPLTMKEKHA